MSASFPSVRRLLLPAAAILLAGCGAAHPHVSSTHGPTIVINLNGSTPAGAVSKASAQPNVVAVAAPAGLSASARASFRAGEEVAEQSGCLGCHDIGANGNNGPGPSLTRVGAHLSRTRIERTLVNPTAPMPSFAALPATKLHDLVAFLADLR